MKSDFKILVGCEISGIVSNAFAGHGYNVTSCDILPSIGYHNHIQQSILDIDISKFDMLIAFPPCTYLSFASGRRWLGSNCDEQQIEALNFFTTLFNAQVAHVCLENPRGFAMKFIPHSQRIEPYYFGHNYTKSTYLWLKNLPLLIHSSQPNLFEPGTHQKPEFSFVRKTRGSRNRSMFHNGIAKAMAVQWDKYLSDLYQF